MKVVAAILDLIYPPLCAVCDQSCKLALCEECASKLEWISGEVCDRCGAAKRNACPECAGRTFTFAGAAAIARYEGRFRDLMLRFKLGGQAYLARELGARMAQAVLDAALPADIVVPVPMSHWASLKRGYNPAEELADVVSRKLRRRLVPALRKTRNTKPQASLPKEERTKNPSDAFRVTKNVRGRSALLVDDVLTTGGTANECSRVLLEAGAKSVHLVVAGR